MRLFGQLNTIHIREYISTRLTNLYFLVTDYMIFGYHIIIQLYRENNLGTITSQIGIHTH